ncbi:MAG TPA: response regulator [Patescibacteria group bacterium]|nr:response regulator [Patescibacteria group bacterium]
MIYINNNKIAIIDDDPAIVEIYKKKLEEEEFVVFIARDGEEGIRMIRENKPDLALVDLCMPGKDGAELMDEIRKDNSISRTRIIILTNSDDMETVEKIKKFNANFYIVKALTTPQKVVDMVKEALV